MKTNLVFSSVRQFTGRENENFSYALLQKLDTEHYDLIITITSDAMVPATHGLVNTPWLFTNINNPKFFGIRDINKPGNNKSGVTYYVPAIKQVAFFNYIMSGGLKKVGVIFDHYAKSRRAELIEFKEALIKSNIEYIIKLVRKKNDLPLVVKKMIEKNVNAIILTSSNKLYNNINLILEQSTKKKIPIFSVNKKAVSKGAISALASDYYNMVDENLIPMVINVLKNGKNPGSIPVQYVKNPLIYLNLTQANKIGLRIPRDLEDRISKRY